MSDLTELKLHIMLLSEAAVRVVSEMENLADLEIVIGNLTETGPASLTKLWNLRRLQIQQDELIPDAIVHIAKMAKLTELGLSLPKTPTSAFAQLGELAELKRLDLSGNPNLKGDLRPNPETTNCPAHAIMCRVKYPGSEGLGLLLYLKLSVTGNEPELINRYRALHPEFPHQSTADQFFDEEQFEAYRQLGVHVAESMFSRALTNGMTRPPSIEAWFRQLASNLMVP